MTAFTKQEISAKTFAITAEVDGEEKTFTVVVGESEDEIQGLVDFYIDSIKNPPAPPVPTYAQLRAQAYPPITDYIDGVVKGDQAQIDAYIAACLAVKAQYPK
jgi:hypothetical protein